MTTFRDQTVREHRAAGHVALIGLGTHQRGGAAGQACCGSLLAALDHFFDTPAALGRWPRKVTGGPDPVHRSDHRNPHRRSRTSSTATWPAPTARHTLECALVEGRQPPDALAPVERAATDHPRSGPSMQVRTTLSTNGTTAPALTILARSAGSWTSWYRRLRAHITGHWVPGDTRPQSERAASTPIGSNRQNGSSGTKLNTPPTYAAPARGPLLARPCGQARRSRRSRHDGRDDRRGPQRGAGCSRQHRRRRPQHPSTSPPLPAIRRRTSRGWTTAAERVRRRPTGKPA